MLEHLSDYGFGPVTPFYISVGSELVGIVENTNNKYFLNFNGKKIALKETYFNAVHEAEKYIVDTLQLFVKTVELDIITRSGSLWFFGESFGRPYDNMHRIKSIHYDGELLVICFDQWEELFVYNPEGIESSEKELKISKASKVKWSYIPYGSMTKRRIETYLCKNNGIVKVTEFGEKEIQNDKNLPAVVLVGD